MTEITYIGAHMRVWRAKGKASKQACPCGQPAKEWAYTHDNPCPNEMVSPLGQKYSADIERYIAMCFRCHRLYDKAEITHCPQGHEYTEENTLVDGGGRKCKTCVYQRNQAWRANNPMTKERHERRMQLQRERRAKARKELAA